MHISMKKPMLAAGALTVAMSMAGWAGASELPKQFAWTAYGTTSAGYAASVAVGNALAEDGYKLRVLPAKNDISRMTPLKNKRVQFSAMGVGSFQAQEGVLDFGKESWGPQPVRLILMGWSDTNNALPATAKDADIMKASDMKGKRIAWVIGAPALNQHMTAWLAYGDLGWNDVEKVEVPGWKASIQGIIDGNIDAAIASTNSSMLFQLESSPRGLRFFEAPKEEAAHWKRLHMHAPWLVPHVATSGVGLSADNPHVGATFGYPVLITYTFMTEGAVYELTKLMHTKYDKYKDAHASAKGFAMDRQVFKWVLPFHDGAVKYFKEIGVWSDDAEAHQQSLLKRQQILMDTWKKAGSGADYEKWMKMRAEALTAAGYDPVWGG